MPLDHSNDAFFPGQFWVQSLGTQGPPGSIDPVPATLVHYGPATDCIPPTVQSVDDALAWFEANIACILNPTALVASPDCNILKWDAATSTVTTAPIGTVLGDQVPGTTDDTILVYNTGLGTYQPVPLTTWLLANMPNQIGQILDAAFPCLPGQILTCGPNGWAVGAVDQALAIATPGANTFDVLAWDAGTGLYAPFPISGMINNTLGLPAQPGSVMLVDNTGNGLAAADFCNEVYTCLGGTLNPGQFYYNSGVGPAPTDLNTVLSGAVQPLLGLPGTPGNVVVIDPTGTALSSANLCGEVYNCLGGTLSPGDVYYNAGAGSAPTPISGLIASQIGPALGLPGTPGHHLVVDPSGNGVSLEPPTTGITGNDGDTVFIDASGEPQADTYLNYLDTYYPAGSSGQTCSPEQLLNDGSGWKVGKGVPEAPTTWTYPLAPQSVGLELETNPTTKCSEWVAPSHVVGTFSIPGDFPTIADFFAWAVGRSLMVTLNVTANEGAFSANGVSGTVVINANANTIGPVTVPQNSPRDLQIRNAFVDGLRVTQGAHVQLVATTIIGVGGTVIGTSETAALIVENGGSVYSSTNLSATPAGGADNGISVSNGGSLLVGGDLGANGFASGSGIRLNGGSIFSVGEISAQSSRNGLTIISGNVETVGNLFLNNNSNWGLVLPGGGLIVGGNASFNANGVGGAVASGGTLGIAGFSNAQNNGSFGVLAQFSSMEFNGGLNSDGNAFGATASNAGSIYVTGGPFQSNNNTNRGVWLNTSGRMNVVNSVAGTQNNSVGLIIDSGGQFYVGGSTAFTITGNNTGISASGGGRFARINPSTVSNTGNTVNTNIPINTLAADGSYIQI